MTPSRPPEVPEPESPRVPGFRTWRGVYVFVFAWFIVVVIALAFFTRAFE